MTQTAQFRVDPRLASLLGANYRSIEQAIRELVDNAWDADAETVAITLPKPMTDEPIVIEDDGCGMTAQELRDEYLLIASDRWSRRGAKTARFKRPVRGRKGIGKFAGLVAANVMRVETCRDRKRSSLEIAKEQLLAAQADLERINLPFSVEDCHHEQHGTKITLCHLNGRFTVPQPEPLKERLALEYGRFAGFNIEVNGQPLSHDDIQGEAFSDTAEISGAGSVTLRFTIMQESKGVKHAGIVTRVGGKLVGKPAWFGLDEDDDIPRKLLNRVVGEIEADGLADEDITADWGALFDDSRAVQEIQRWAKTRLKEAVEDVFSREVSLAKARRKKQIDAVLSRLPEHRRQYATKHLERVMKRFYGESEEKVDALISVVLDAFERDEYWTVCQKINDAKHSEVSVFAEALQEFGLVDMAFMAVQARRRLQFLDDLDALTRNDATLESEMHKALEGNLWVFGPEYSLMSSNQTLKQTIEEHTNKKFSGERAKKRPDLFLAQNVLRRYLLIEFKRPSHTVDRDDESQAEKYRDDLTRTFGMMDILVIGGKVSQRIQSQYQQADIRLLTYDNVISTARTQLEWLIENLTGPPRML